jgi:hypothetical protein
MPAGRCNLETWASRALTCSVWPLLAGGGEGNTTANGVAAHPDTAGGHDQLQHKGNRYDSSAAQARTAKQQQQQQQQSAFDAPSKAGQVALMIDGSSSSSSSEGLEVMNAGDNSGSGRSKREGASYSEQVQVLVARAVKVRRWVASWLAMLACRAWQVAPACC